jgi:hypothetical protein
MTGRSGRGPDGDRAMTVLAGREPAAGLAVIGR